MKSNFQLSALLAVMALCLLAQGCVDGPVAAAEKSVTLSYKTTNAFLKFDHENRAALQRTAPQVRAIAEKIRVEAPPAFNAAWDSIYLFKTTRSDTAKATMEAKVSRTTNLGAEAASNLAAGTTAIGANTP